MAEQKKSWRAIRREQMLEAMRGTGRYIFRNRLHTDQMLPKPGNGGERVLAPGQEFEGDSYFMQLVPEQLDLIADVEAMEKAYEAAKEEIKKEGRQKTEQQTTQEPAEPEKAKLVQKTKEIARARRQQKKSSVSKTDKEDNPEEAQQQ